MRFLRHNIEKGVVKVAEKTYLRKSRTPDIEQQIKKQDLLKVKG